MVNPPKHLVGGNVSGDLFDRLLGDPELLVGQPDLITQILLRCLPSVVSELLVLFQPLVPGSGGC